MSFHIWIHVAAYIYMYADLFARACGGWRMNVLSLHELPFTLFLRQGLWLKHVIRSQWRILLLGNAF